MIEETTRDRCRVNEVLAEKGEPVYNWRRGGEEARRRGGEEARRRGGEEARRRGGEEARRRGGEEARRRGGEARCADTDAEWGLFDLANHDALNSPSQRPQPI